MYTKYKSLIIQSFIFTCIVGPLMHFAYEASNNNAFVSLIAPINESVWEHTKLTFFPFVIFLLIRVFFSKKAPNNFFSGIFISSFLGIISVPILFYFYTFFTKHSIFIFDIAIFFIAVAIEHIVILKIFNKGPIPFVMDLIFLGLIVCVFILFAYLTENAPNMDLFKSALLCLRR